MPAVAPRPRGDRRHDLLTAHLPAVLWLVVMTVALAVPANTADLPTWWPEILHFQALDKVIHFLLFSVAAMLLTRSFRRLPGRLSNLPRPALMACLAAIAYGGATEVGQHFLTARQGELADFLADGVGALAGAGAAVLAVRRGGKVP